MKLQNNNHYHYEVLGYAEKVKNKKNPNQMDLVEGISITLLASSEEDALQKAIHVAECRHYQVVRAWECFEIHGLQIEMQIMQLEIQKQQLDAMKGHGHE